MSKVINPYEPNKTGKDFPLWFQFFIASVWIIIPCTIGGFLGSVLYHWIME